MSFLVKGSRHIEKEEEMSHFSAVL